MFKKKNCKKCGEKVNNNHNFCPSCGSRINSNNNDWGMLGKNDRVENNSMPPMMGGGMLNKMVGNMMKMLEKEMQKGMKETNNPKTNFRLMINGKEIPMNQIPQKKEFKKEKTIKTNSFSTENLKKFSSLPREEPKTELKRFADKIIYEVSIPEVKSLDDVSITSLENSMEIKAIGKTKAYYKIVSINFPIISQNLDKGKLILELKDN